MTSRASEEYIAVLCYKGTCQAIRSQSLFVEWFHQVSLETMAMENYADFEIASDCFLTKISILTIFAKFSFYLEDRRYNTETAVMNTTNVRKQK